MNWESLADIRQIEEIKNLSKEIPVLIYKHSSRCSTSSMILHRLERSWKAEDAKVFKPFFLDLIAYRNISNAIASVFNVEHESPQILIIDKGNSIHDWSHFEINYQTILDSIQN
jgi:bacillithiol system protein YtxJ